MQRVNNDTLGVGGITLEQDDTAFRLVGDHSSRAEHLLLGALGQRAPHVLGTVRTVEQHDGTGGGHLEVARVAGPLQHLEVEDGGDVLHRGASEHFACQVEHDQSGRKALGYCAEKRLRLGFVQAVL